MKQNSKEKEIDNKIETYFLDPFNTRDEYRLIYKKNHSGRIKKDEKISGKKYVRYSPLYYIRRELLYLLNKISVSTVEFYPIITAYTVVETAIDGLIMDIYGLDRKYFGYLKGCIECNCKSCERIDKDYFKKSEQERSELEKNKLIFMKQMMKLNNNQMESLRKLRNTLTHNFYKLVDRNKKGEKIIYDVNEGTNEKIAYYEKRQKSGKTIHFYYVYPESYYKTFENGIIILNDKVKKNKTYRDLFEKNIDLDQWMAEEW